MIDFDPPRPEPAILGGAPVVEPITIPLVASVVTSARLTRYARVLTEIGSRWGTDAASSLMAALGGAVDHPSFVLVVRVFGSVAWVEHGNGMRQPSALTPLFVHAGAWVGWPTGRGVQIAITEAADACLAAPRETLEAICHVTRAKLYDTPELVKTWHPDAPLQVLALARPVRAVGRELHGLVDFKGAVGPLVLDVDTAKATLRPLLQKPWKPQVLL